MANDIFKIIETREEKTDCATKAIVVPTLRLDQYIEPTATALNSLAHQIESISVWNPFGAFFSHKKYQTQFETFKQKYIESVDHCHKRMRDPVEGGNGIDNAWMQGFSTSLGTSALIQLQSTYQNVNESLDRKAAYSLAAISLYISIISIVLTIVFGWLSLK